MEENERRVARARDIIGDGAELMLDCYMALDVDYAVRLAERLRPYRLRWIEECLIPEDVEGHIQLRRRLPWMTLAAGEHFYTPFPFQQMIKHGCLDVLQPDIHWAGGMTACIKICHMAEAAGLQVILHGGGGQAEGQHLTWAMTNTPWAEYFVGTDPGIPLAESTASGALVPRGGYIDFRPCGPGFGLGIEEEWLEPLGD
jgi:L-rhamnonate dehydratase